MELSSKYGLKFGLKPAILKLHRCDKIWKTIQLIRNAQNDGPATGINHSKTETVVAEKEIDSKSNETGSLNANPSPKLLKPHIKYHPVLNNGNTALPNFQLSVKSRVRLFRCSTCGKEYHDFRDLRKHSEKFHNIILPKRRQIGGRKAKKKEATKPTESLPQSGKSGIAEIHSDHASLAASQNAAKSGIKENKAPLQTAAQIIRSRNNETEKPVVPTTQKAKSKKSDIDSHCVRSNEELVKENTKIVANNDDFAQQSRFVKCELCKRSYKNIRKHIVEYHKIKSPDVITKVSKQQCQPVKDSIAEKPNMKAEKPNMKAEKPNMKAEKPNMKAEKPNMKAEKPNTKAEKPNTKAEKPSMKAEKPNMKAEKSRSSGKPPRMLIKAIGKLKVQSMKSTEQQDATNSKKRKLDMPSVVPAKKLKVDSPLKKASKRRRKGRGWRCDICLEILEKRAFLRKHRRNHVERGETKYNFNKDTSTHLVSKGKNSLQNSPGPRDRRDDNANNNITNPIERGRRLRSSAMVSASGSQTKKDGSAENSCPCGRSFRNAYVLFAHKANCKISIDADADKLYESRISSDRDSGIGISITIKKKNDSYEIVSRESSDEEKSKASPDSSKRKLSSYTSDESSEDCEGEGRKDGTENLIPESSKYSKDHSVLKLQVTEEDVDVDIEDDSQDDGLRKDTVYRGPGDDFNVTTEEDLRGPNDEIPRKAGRYVPPLRVLCKNYFIKKGLLPREERTHKCWRCQKFLGTKERLLAHAVRHRRLINRACICGERFRTITAFDLHVIESHPKRVTCAYCKERFHNIVEAEEHVCFVDEGTPYRETSDDSHPCPNCDSVFPLIKLLESHIKADHSDPDLPFQCYKCTEKFPSKVLQNVHLNRMHSRCNSACSVCNQKFRSENMKNHHVAYHEGLGYPCHMCRKTYRSRMLRTKHRESCHSDNSNEEIVCFVCQKSVKAKSYKKHVSRHNSVLQCELCTKVLYDTRSLEMHIVSSHAGQEYPRKKCNLCGILFSTKEQLEAHILEEKLAGEFFKSVVKEEVLLDGE